MTQETETKFTCTTVPLFHRDCDVCGKLKDERTMGRQLNFYVCSQCDGTLTNKELLEKKHNRENEDA